MLRETLHLASIFLNRRLFLDNFGPVSGLVNGGSQVFSDLAYSSQWTIVKNAMFWEYTDGLGSTTVPSPVFLLIALANSVAGTHIVQRITILSTIPPSSTQRYRV